MSSLILDFISCKMNSQVTYHLASQFRCERRCGGGDLAVPAGADATGVGGGGGRLGGEPRP